MPIQCPKCGKVNDGSTYFCIYCGAIFEEYESKDNEIPEMFLPKKLNSNNKSNIQNTIKIPEQRNNHRLAIYLGYLFAILGGLIGLIIAIYLITRKDPIAKKHGKIQIGILLLWLILFLVMIYTGAIDYHTILNATMLNNTMNYTDHLSLGNFSFGF